MNPTLVVHLLLIALDDSVLQDKKGLEILLASTRFFNTRCTERTKIFRHQRR